MAPPAGTHRPKKPPIWPQDGPREHQGSQRNLQDGLMTARDGPRTAQDGPKGPASLRTLEGPKTA
eukprot:6688897-Pyramimonas_sp.AAC.1